MLPPIHSMTSAPHSPYGQEKDRMAWNCIIRWGTYIALATGLIFGSASNASADACWEHWVAKLNAMAAVSRKYEARLRATGDCSYVQKIVDKTHQYVAVMHAIPCQNVNQGIPFSDNAIRAKFMRYCKPSPKTPRQETAKVQPESPKIPRQKTAKVQPETRPSKPATQMPAPVNENAQRSPTPARHLRPASAEAFPEQRGTAPADASALPERPTSPGPSNAQTSCSGKTRHTWVYSGICAANPSVLFNRLDAEADAFPRRRCNRTGSDRCQCGVFSKSSGLFGHRGHA